MKRFSSLVITLLISNLAIASRILHFGDSQMVGPVAPMLHKMWKDAGHEVCTRGEWGATPDDYSKPVRTLNGVYYNCPHMRSVPRIPGNKNSYTHSVESIEKTIEKFKPDVAVIQLGGNIIKPHFSESDMEFQISALVKILKANNVNKCSWVMPPNSEVRSQEKYELFKKTLKRIISKSETKCDFIDTDFMLKKDLGDGLHLNTITPSVIAKYNKKIDPKCNCDKTRIPLVTGRMLAYSWAKDIASSVKKNQGLDFKDMPDDFNEPTSYEYIESFLIENLSDLF